MPLPKLSGNPDQDLSPLTGNLDQDLAATQPQQPSLMARAEGAVTGRDPNAIMQKAASVAQGLPKIPAAPPSMAMPGTGILGNMLGQGAAGAGEALMQGRGPLQAAKEGAGAAAGSGALGVLGKGAGKVTSSLGLPSYAEKISKGITDKLKSSVPAWEKMSSLKDMLYTQRGQGAMHRAYDESFNKVIDKAVGKRIDLPLEDIKSLGIKNHLPGKIPSTGEGTEKPAFGTVDAAEVARKIQGVGKKDPGLYRRTTDLLQENGVGDPAARKAYTTACPFCSTHQLLQEVLHRTCRDIVSRNLASELGAMICAEHAASSCAA